MLRARVRTTLAVLFACAGAAALVQSPVEDLRVLAAWQLVNALTAALAAMGAAASWYAHHSMR